MDTKIEKVTDSEHAVAVTQHAQSVIDHIGRTTCKMAPRFSVAAPEDCLAAEREMWPKAELAEQDRKYVLSVALPGFEAADISVKATQRAVSVHARLNGERKDGHGAKHWSEFKSNDMYRRFEFAKAIEVQSLSASLVNGILKILAIQGGEVGGEKSVTVPVLGP